MNLIISIIAQNHQGELQMHSIHDDQHRKDQHGTEKTNQTQHGIYTRRALLRRITAAGIAGMLLPGLLSACGNKNDAGQSATGGTCTDTGSLTLIQQANRRAVNYTDESSHTEKTCNNCRFFKQPGTEATCGECEVVSGPIAAAGYCNAWAG